jgi:hypothetical protein
VDNAARDAGYDGQFLTSVAEAPRDFDPCSCGEGINVVESLTLAVLSSSQSIAAGGQCPPNVLDGGLPLGSPPAFISGIYDAQLLCGELTDVLTPAADARCLCLSADASYELSGARQ